MTRRTSALLASLLLLVALLAGAFVLHVPYVSQLPGPTTDTLGAYAGAPLISISGAGAPRTYPTKGELRLTTVREQDSLSLATAVRDWLSGSDAVIPVALTRSPGQSQAQLEQVYQQQMQQSQDDATSAALRYLHLPGVLSVATLSPSSPSLGKLRVNDVITAIGGMHVATSTALVAAIRAHRPGQVVVLAYRRGKATGTARITLGASPADPRIPLIGVSLVDKPTFTVRIGLKGVGGPSAGLMFALGIIDRLTPGALAGGRIIAGTGTITPDGTVGAIGGIVQKMIGSKQTGATVFLAPADNCLTVRGHVPSGLRVIKVSSLSGAVSALTALQAGRTDLPTC